jgi:hypothetical protein
MMKVSEYIHVILKPFALSPISLLCYYVHHARVGDVTYSIRVYTSRSYCGLHRERSLSIPKILTKWYYSPLLVEM